MQHTQNANSAKIRDASYSEQSKARGDMPCAPSSPIDAMLQAIQHELNVAHEEASMLENRVEPIRAVEPESTAGTCTPREVMPTRMEDQLREIHDTVRYLANRLRKTTSELRI